MVIELTYNVGLCMVFPTGRYLHHVEPVLGHFSKAILIKGTDCQTYNFGLCMYFAYLFTFITLSGVITRSEDLGQIAVLAKT